MTPRLLQWILRIAALPVLLLVVVEVALGFWFYGRTSAFLDTAVPVVGEVVELRESRGGEGGTTWTPVFTWTDAAGKARRGSVGWSSNPPSHEVGHPIDLFYDPAAPEDVRVDGFFSLWAGPAFLWGFAAVQSVFVIALGLLAPWAVGRFWKPAPSD